MLKTLSYRHFSDCDIYIYIIECDHHANLLKFVRLLKRERNCSKAIPHYSSYYVLTFQFHCKAIQT